ncbi:hypothetical protein [Pseudonocardia sp. 73-21]|uniref:hypothetical protein n=1 Tax=Pseudonocardia sp. 73-21 TaxID=1895809 RepID=UPI0009692C80|nr:hypothetical protein [Pseudonocardia sp. 73-21]OJY42331.1 MAG: hypothetical protein BGP03_10315 [Pseudonocardia sp. 73-21]
MSAAAASRSRALRELAEIGAAISWLHSQSIKSDATGSTRSAEIQEALALLYAREAGWWAVLRHHAPRDLAHIYRVAMIKARSLSRARAVDCGCSAREWRRLAATAAGGDVR